MNGKLLKKINSITEKPLIFLSFVWLGLLVYEFVYGLTPTLEAVIYILWGVFILDFVVEFALSGWKTQYIKNNFLIFISLFIPAFRILRIFRSFRVLRATRAVRSVSLVRILATLNQGFKTLQEVFGGSGVKYIALFTIIMVFAGAAGIFYFENNDVLTANGIPVNSSAQIQNYGDALWFTAMLLMTIGSEYWPKTLEGRILTFFLSLYAVGVFGFITATIASLLIGKKSGKR